MAETEGLAMSDHQGRTLMIRQGPNQLTLMIRTQGSAGVQAFIDLDDAQSAMLAGYLDGWWRRRGEAPEPRADGPLPAPFGWRERQFLAVVTEALLLVGANPDIWSPLFERRLINAARAADLLPPGV